MAMFVAEHHQGAVVIRPSLEGSPVVRGRRNSVCRDAVGDGDVGCKRDFVLTEYSAC